MGDGSRSFRLVRGFTLVELLLTLSLGLVLSGIMLQALLGETTSSQRFGRLLRERARALRGLELIRDELQLASVAAAEPIPAPAAGEPCALAGRTPVLHLQTVAGPITYTLGSPPDATIWRGQVLMRCGPAYGLDGQLNPGTPQNRVLLDGLEKGGFQIRVSSDSQAPTGAAVLRLQLTQSFETADGQPQRIVTLQQAAVANWQAGQQSGA